MHWEERGVQGHGVEHSSSVSIFVSLRLKTLVFCVRSIRILELHNGGSSWCQLAHFCIHVQIIYLFIYSLQGCVDINFVNAVLCRQSELICF